ncbi:MAG: glycosyltransferase family 4 protein [Sphingobium sp.]
MASRVSRSPRVILVTAAYFPDSYGGAERQATILAQALGRQGVDVTLVAPTVSADAPLAEATGFGRILRKRVRAYPNLGGRNILSFLAWSLWMPRAFRSTHWRGVPVYVFHARLHTLAAVLTAMRLGSSLFVKLGGGGEASEFDALRRKKFFYGRWVASLLRRRVAMFVANSVPIAAELRSLGVEDARIAEFPNGVELPSAEFHAAAERRRTGSRFIYMARMLPDKNVDVLYHAAMTAAKGGALLKLALIGDGPEKQRLEAIEPDGQAQETVRFTGFLDDVYPELSAADFFVSASRREGQSNALLEAMSAGVIPVVYAASGVEEVVTDGENGLIVHECSAMAFSAAMNRALALTDDERRQMSRNARTFAEAHIGIDAIAERTRHLMGISKKFG